MTDRVHVPGPAPSALFRRRSEPVTSLPHVLVVGDPTEDPHDREWEIEHHADCPAFCAWLPAGRVGYFTLDGDDEDEYRGEVEYGCPVAWELEGNGIDSLSDREGHEWRTYSWMAPSLAVGLDQLLAPGRYRIEGWYHSGAGQGEYGGQGDPDAGLTLLPGSVHHSAAKVPGAVYIGRPTVWGNPFVIGQHGDRATVIALYRDHLAARPDLLARLPELAGKPLACWCSPEPCHGDVLAELANA